MLPSRDPMKVFISWSGKRSKAVAEALRGWVPKVIQSVEPLLSSEFQVGARWTEDIGKSLEETDFGIICLTPENLEKPWILFEAGALSKRLDTARVCPYLYQLDHSAVEGPLVMFQAARAEKEDTRKLLESINTASKPPLATDTLNEAFELWWPRLEKQLEKIPSQEEGRRPSRSQGELLEEILELVREQARGSRVFLKSAGTVVRESAGPVIGSTVKLPEGELFTLYPPEITTPDSHKERITTPDSHKESEGKK